MTHQEKLDQLKKEKEELEAKIKLQEQVEKTKKRKQEAVERSRAIVSDLVKQTHSQNAYIKELYEKFRKKANFPDEVTLSELFIRHKNTPTGYYLTDSDGIQCVWYGEEIVEVVEQLQLHYLDKKITPIFKSKSSRSTATWSFTLSYDLMSTNRSLKRVETAIDKIEEYHSKKNRENLQNQHVHKTLAKIRARFETMSKNGDILKYSLDSVQKSYFYGKGFWTEHILSLTMINGNVAKYRVSIHNYDSDRAEYSLMFVEYKLPHIDQHKNKSGEDVLNKTIQSLKQISTPAQDVISFFNAHELTDEEVADKQYMLDLAYNHFDCNLDQEPSQKEMEDIVGIYVSYRKNA